MDRLHAFSAMVVVVIVAIVTVDGRDPLESWGLGNAFARRKEAREGALNEGFERHDAGARDGCVDFDGGPVDQIGAVVCRVRWWAGGVPCQRRHDADESDETNNGDYANTRRRVGTC